MLIGGCRSASARRYACWRSSIPYMGWKRGSHVEARCGVTHASVSERLCFISYLYEAKHEGHMDMSMSMCLRRCLVCADACLPARCLLPARLRRG